MPDGTTVEAEKMEFKPQKEDWNIYELPDGAIVKLKTIVTAIYRHTARDELTGQHNYTVNHNSIVVAEEPEEV